MKRRTFLKGAAAVAVTLPLSHLALSDQVTEFEKAHYAKNYHLPCVGIPSDVPTEGYMRIQGGGFDVGDTIQFGDMSAEVVALDWQGNEARLHYRNLSS